MNLFRIIGVAALAAGILLLAFGINATHKANEAIVEKLTGRYTDTTTWYIVGGLVLVVLGGGLIVSKRR